MNAMVRRSLYGIAFAGAIVGVIPTALPAQRIASERTAEPRAADVFARLVTVDVKGVSLGRAIDVLSANSGVRISYRGQAIERMTALVTFHANKIPLGVALDAVLQGTNFRADPISADLIIVKAASGTVSMTQGGLNGKVIDAKTKLSIRGASVTVVTGGKASVTNADGTFRFPDLTPGSYTITARMLGYVKSTKTVTIAEGQTAAIEISMEQSVSALDEVVVTGTVVAVEQRTIPNAMTIITAKDIEQRGITHIDQLFRGDVPGVFASNTGAKDPLGQVTMFSRGTTGFDGTANTNPIKTYVDGVEVADPSYLSQIDPRSIERIEILTGPQASTIYGSNALNGVMQIFTKRGSQSRPQLTLSLQSGWIENSAASARTPRHDNTVQLNGVDGHWSYNTGGSWTYTGRWTPAIQQSVTSGFGGARIQQGPFTGDVSLRLSTTQNQSRGYQFDFNKTQAEQGFVAPVYYYGNKSPSAATLNGQTLGLTLGFAPTSWWSHELVVGTDGSDTKSQSNAAGHQSPSDTSLSLSQTTNHRTSIRYSTTARASVTDATQLVVTTGADAWKALATDMSASPSALTGTLSGASWQVNRHPAHNAGGFVQAQFGIADALFLTYGLRAEWNPNYGADAQPNLAPRYGIAWTKELGAVTAKVRASYGRSTRPPATGEQSSVSFFNWYAQQGFASYAAPFVTLYGPFDVTLANPDLEPEIQRGGEGGVELYLGNRASLVITRYNQTVDHLITALTVDSARTLQPLPLGDTHYDHLGSDGYGYVMQGEYLNVGNIRNQGWEAQGTFNVGALTARGSWSLTKSRMIGIDPRYRSLLSYQSYQKGAVFSNFPEHTWALGLSYGLGATAIALNLNGIGQMYRLNGNWDALALSMATNVRLAMYRPRMSDARLYRLEDKYQTADLNATHRFSTTIEGVFQVQNLTNTYENDVDTRYGVLGRQTNVGVRLRF